MRKFYMADFLKLNPNILLTEKCNQSCSYCFAKKKMEETAKKEMSADDIRKIVGFLEKNGQDEIKLMGGEPTLHSQFKEIIDFILSRGFKIKLFTNSLFSKDLAEWLSRKGGSINYSVNLSTPAFGTEAGRSAIARNLNLFNDSRIEASVTIDSLEFEPSSLIEFVKNNNIQSVKFGVANKLIGDKNWLPFEQYKNFSFLIYSLIKKLKEEINVNTITFNCGFTPCMFEQGQIDYFLKKKVRINGWGCAGKWGSFDISADLNIFPCFVLKDLGGRNIFAFKDLRAADKFVKNLLKYAIYKSPLSTFEFCKKCLYYKHYKNLKCFGPCLGYVINNLNGQKLFEDLLNAPRYKIINRLLYTFRNWV